jgi:adenylate cyclase
MPTPGWGKRDKAFRLLDEAYDAHDHQMAQLKVNPAFDSLRPDPRFDALLRRMKLQP